MKLTEEVLLKIDKTVLAEVLLEEGNEEYSMLSSATAEDKQRKRSGSLGMFVNERIKLTVYR